MNIDQLRDALKQTCVGLPHQVEDVPLEHWNESVFRWLLIRYLRAVTPETECWSEWNRVDLVLVAPSGSTLIELKFFAHRPLAGTQSRRVRMKGGPSAKNLREFRSSINTLAASATRPWARDLGRIIAGYFILLYLDPATGDEHATYGSCYDTLEPAGSIMSVETIVENLPVDAHMVLTCKLLKVRIATA